MRDVAARGALDVRPPGGLSRSDRWQSARERRYGTNLTVATMAVNVTGAEIASAAQQLGGLRVDWQ